MPIALQSDGRGTEMRRSTERENGFSGRACTECGQPAKYTYRVHHGGRPLLLGAPTGQNKPFCSIDCFRSYSR